MRRRFVAHRSRERRLRTAKIKETLDATGKLACEVPDCGFDFYEVYGAAGHGFAHVHHIEPLARMSGKSKTRLSDLAIVCANCHAMIHLHGESRSLDDVRPRKRKRAYAAA